MMKVHEMMESNSLLRISGIGKCRALAPIRLGKSGNLANVFIPEWEIMKMNKMMIPVTKEQQKERTRQRWWCGSVFVRTEDLMK